MGEGRLEWAGWAYRGVCIPHPGDSRPGAFLGWDSVRVMLGTGMVGMGGRDRHVGTAEGLVTQGLVAQGQIPAVVVVVTWVAGCAAVV